VYIKQSLAVFSANYQQIKPNPIGYILSYTSLYRKNLCNYVGYRDFIMIFLSLFT